MAKASGLVGLFSVLSVVLTTVSSAAVDTSASILYTCVQNALTGSDVTSRIVCPSDETYPDARTTTIVHDEYPAMLAYAISVEEVSNLVMCGHSTGVQVVPRSGGHHFAAWSSLNNSLVIDISHINSVSVSEDNSTATVGGGIRLGGLYTALNNHGLTFHGGICPTVGLGGYVGVGGYNIQGRQFGMAVDDVTSMQIVLATGEIVTASSTENHDLWWGARGGGTYGIVVSITVNVQVFPRSATINIQYPNSSTRYEVTRKYIDWAPRQVVEFGSQINMYRIFVSDHTNMVAWYMGKTANELQALLETSGLLDIPGAQINLQNNCSTLNSRNFWSDYSKQIDCSDDAAGEAYFESVFNVVPQAFEPIEPAFSFNEVTMNSNYPQAAYWPRVNIIDKNYMILNDNQWSDDTLHEIIDRIGQVPIEEYFWAELTSFNITSPHPSNSSAFPWSSNGYALFRAEIETSTNVSSQARNEAWFDSFDTFLTGRMGTASYSGYTDAELKSNPYTAYYGDNVCNLVKVKQQYDPEDFFRNSFSIPPYVPDGVTC